MWFFFSFFFLWETKNTLQKMFHCKTFPIVTCSLPLKSWLNCYIQSSTLHIIRYFLWAIFIPFISFLLFLRSRDCWTAIKYYFWLENRKKGWFSFQLGKSFNLQNLPSYSNQLENTFIFCFDQLILILPVCWLSSD